MTSTPIRPGTAKRLGLRLPRHRATGGPILTGARFHTAPSGLVCDFVLPPMAMVDRGSIALYERALAAHLAHHPPHMTEGWTLRMR